MEFVSIRVKDGMPTATTHMVCLKKIILYFAKTVIYYYEALKKK